jgi:hypothetical protein
MYEYYDIQEGETPEIISEKVYGTAFYHWTLMLANQKYDYANDYPLTAAELAEYVTAVYGAGKEDHIHHYVMADTGVQKEGINQLVLTNVTSGAVDLVKEGALLTNADGYKGAVSIGGIITPSNGSTITVSVYIREGRFSVSDHIQLYDYTASEHPTITLAVTSSYIPEIYVPVTNSQYEDQVNESKRRIKIISPDVIERVVQEFQNTI